MGAAMSQEGLLAIVGLPPGAVRNVLMHKDLVPRAFACDYRLVADLLRRVNEAFREHACLNTSGRVVRACFHQDSQGNASCLKNVSRHAQHDLLVQRLSPDWCHRLAEAEELGLPAREIKLQRLCAILRCQRSSLQDIVYVMFLPVEADSSRKILLAPISHSWEGLAGL